MLTLRLLSQKLGGRTDEEYDEDTGDEEEVNGAWLMFEDL